MDGERKKRRHFKQVFTLKVRLENAARECRKAAQSLRPGTERETLLREARRYEAAAALNDWLSSPTLSKPQQIQNR